MQAHTSCILKKCEGNRARDSFRGKQKGSLTQRKELATCLDSRLRIFGGQSKKAYSRVIWYSSISIDCDT